MTEKSIKPREEDRKREALMNSIINTCISACDDIMCVCNETIEQNYSVPVVLPLTRSPLATYVVYSCIAEALLFSMSLLPFDA